jgi:hypothetical protein
MLLVSMLLIQHGTKHSTYHDRHHTATADACMMQVCVFITQRRISLITKRTHCSHQLLLLLLLSLLL